MEGSQSKSFLIYCPNLKGVAAVGQSTAAVAGTYRAKEKPDLPTQEAPQTQTS